MSIPNAGIGRLVGVRGYSVLVPGLWNGPGQTGPTKTEIDRWGSLEDFPSTQPQRLNVLCNSHRHRLTFDDDLKVASVVFRINPGAEANIFAPEIAPVTIDQIWSTEALA
ncbi:uncharacterized protein UV8b_06650 [Ustilaginoidea virens]|uniref:Uncharacterized protein n=1 Tax=Ustilaginoidea virens TaxID=1159556 RepID=A0A8E5HWA4_USTVR|nr:uncharacterized protein UV8b_06650 [Ustilaginoidea virens]QUC22409.1 hypothetical protein UV8b_06650 [Ustilaginoidea virens]